MRLTAEEIAAAMGAEILSEGEPGSPKRATIASGDAGPGDVVVIAGKGHEQGQEFEGGRKEPFDDVTVAREALRSRVAT